ncbi:tRNA (adenosine(37)-N6)-threonylcarbamoyltransferase complex transferase subunit TsaD [Candidatus Woesearchaeota archaeon]|nr:tRNA (adenosine(37)-N6)-threonylcarbamoyltransferase complex transferase subunit TsaD [Candidatus Woesearchaeota archaeon]
MLVLGIESTAHTFGVSVVDANKKKVFSNIMDSFSTEQGGMIPGDVGRHHVGCCQEVIQQALDKAGVKISQIKLISFSQGPGLGNALKVGATAARSLSLIHNIPLVGVNHCIAHLEIGRMLTPAKDPILLYASGANTQVIAFEEGKYRIFGETLDTGIGNFIDTFARYLGLGFPGGPKIEQLAKEGRKNSNFIELPYSIKGMDVAFSGLLTNIRHKISKDMKEGKFTKEDLCYSVQETVFAMLIEVSERAMAHCGKTELVLGGGVACNKRLQKMCDIMCKERSTKSQSCKSFVVENQFNVDNGAMIAWLGYLKFKAEGPQKIEDTAVRPYERTDDVQVAWR